MSKFYLVDLKGILFLLKFLKEYQLNNSDTTKNLLSATQVTIRASGALKDKMKDFMSSLVMNIQNMEEIWQITCSSSKFEILHYFDQEKYLQRSLLHVPSSAYLIKWAQYFLARTQLASDLEMKRSKILLESYIDCLKKDQTHFIGVSKAIDAILGAFDQSAEHDRFRLIFIQRLIDLCFQQSISFDFSSSFLQYFLFRFNFCGH